MTGREIILNAMRGQSTPRVPWLPFVGVHGGQLIDTSATDYLQSPDAITRGLCRANELYRPDGLPIAFDLQLEAEVLGCDLHWADRTPPSVISHPLSLMEGPGMTLDELPEFSVEKGRFPVVLEALRQVRKQLGEQVALYGLITGPFTLTLHLMGNDVFLAMFDEPDNVKRIMALAARIGQQTARAYLDHGADVIAVVDPMTSQISPEHFQAFVAEPINDVFNAVHSAGGLASLFVCGDATRNLEVMCRTQADNLCIDENIPLEKVRDLTRAAGKSFGGNLKLTTALLLGNQADCRADALRCFDTGGERNFILAPGCDLPYDVPPENLQAVAELVHDPYARDVARQARHVDVADSFDDVAIPDYPKLPEVVVDVITLDSAACAPCQYMVAAAESASRHVQTPVIVREHKINCRDGLGYMTKLGVSNIPSICIDGKVAFKSQIPDTNTLADAIRQVAQRKKE